MCWECINIDSVQSKTDFVYTFCACFFLCLQFVLSLSYLSVHLCVCVCHLSTYCLLFGVQNEHALAKCIIILGTINRAKCLEFNIRFIHIKPWCAVARRRQETTYVFTFVLRGFHSAYWYVPHNHITGTSARQWAQQHNVEFNATNEKVGYYLDSDTMT